MLSIIKSCWHVQQSSNFANLTRKASQNIPRNQRMNRRIFSRLNKDQSHLSGVRLLFQTSGLHSNGWFQHTQTPNQQFMKEFVSFWEFRNAWGMPLQGYVGVFWDCFYFVSKVASLNIPLWIKNVKRGKQLGNKSPVFFTVFPTRSLDVFFLGGDFCLTFWPSFFKFTIMLNPTTLATWQTHHHWPHGTIDLPCLTKKEFSTTKEGKNGHWCSVVLRVECSSWRFCLQKMFTI